MRPGTARHNAIYLMDFRGAKPVGTLLDTMPPQSDKQEELSPEERKRHKRLRRQYVPYFVVDRPNLYYAAKELSRDLTRPSHLRYLIGEGWATDVGQCVATVPIHGDLRGH